MSLVCHHAEKHCRHSCGITVLELVVRESGWPAAHDRAEKEAILIGGGVLRQPWAQGVAAELPAPGAWVPSRCDLATRRDLRGGGRLLASIDPPSARPPAPPASVVPAPTHSRICRSTARVSAHIVLSCICHKFTI